MTANGQDSEMYLSYWLARHLLIEVYGDHVCLGIFALFLLHRECEKQRLHWLG